MSILSVSSDAKTSKGEARGFLTGILYLAPSTVSGRNVCPFASPACHSACLYSAGRGAFSNVQRSRVAKTQAFFADKTAFLANLDKDVAALIAKSVRRSMRPAVRLNGTSDIAWEKTGIMDRFPSVPFYDYTKNPLRYAQFLSGKLPKNYRLVFSRSETNESQALEFLSKGGNVSVVFRKSLPKAWKGYRVIDGDKTDLRFLDPRGVVVGLVAKGKAKKDASGFVVDRHEDLPVEIVPSGSGFTTKVSI